MRVERDVGTGGVASGGRRVSETLAQRFGHRIACLVGAVLLAGSLAGLAVGVVGTLIAALVTATLPAGAWSSELVASFFHGEQVTYAALAVIVGLVAGWGALTLTDARSTEEHPSPAPP